MAIVHKRRWDLHLICIKVHIIRTAAHQSVNEIYKKKNICIVLIKAMDSGGET